MDLIQQSTSLFGSLKNAVLGNPVTREFNIGQQIASFGPGLLWKVFEGKKKSTGQDVSVFIFEKTLVDKYGRRDREEILEKMRRGPQQLTKLRHPRILTVQHPLEESRDSLAFATEPVFASLSNAFEKHENFPGGMPSHLKGFELYAVEKVYGLLQIAEGIAFLHNDANLCEGNITPDNIIITKEGQWKLAGFHFSTSKLDPGSRAEYTTKIALIARQDLNYLAPEYIFPQAGTVEFDLSKADMFSFGCLISAIYNQLKTPFDAGDNIAMYKKCTEQLSRLGSDYLKNVPIGIRDHISVLLNVSGDARPDASLTISHQFFDDVAAMTLKYLDSLVQRDDVTKSQFFKSLHHVLDKLPLRVLHQRMLPPLFSEFPNHMMIPFVLPNVFIIAEKSKKEEYMRLIFPEFKKIFGIAKPIQILLIFMQKMELMLKMTDKDDVKNYVLPLVFKALEAPSEEIQEFNFAEFAKIRGNLFFLKELVLTIIPNFVHMIDYSSLKNSIVPRIKVLVTKSSALRVRVNALVCLGNIIDHLDKFLLIDDIFPIFTQIPSKEPAILMAILGIYKQTLHQSKINLEKDYLATKAIPFLLPLSVEPTLNVSQFNNFMSVIREMFDRVEQEHRTKLEQLQKMHDEQRSSIDFVRAANKNVDTEGTDSMMAKVDNLVIGTPAAGNVSKKSIGANSEFAKMFGLSDEPGNKAKTGSLMGNTPVGMSSSNKTLDVSSFDGLSPSRNSKSPNQPTRNVSTNQPRYSAAPSSNKPMNQMQGSNQSQSNYDRSMNTGNQGQQRQQQQSAMLDSMVNSQLGGMKPPSSIQKQNVGYMNSQNGNYNQQQQIRQQQQQQQPQQQQQYNSNSSGYPQNSRSGMSSGMMQSQTQQLTMFQTQTQMFVPPQQQQQQNMMSSPMMHSNNMNNSMNQNAMRQPPMNSGILQPMNNSGIMLPMGTSQPKTNLSNKDLDDLLL